MAPLATQLEPGRIDLGELPEGRMWSAAATVRVPADRAVTVLGLDSGCGCDTAELIVDGSSVPLPRLLPTPMVLAAGAVAELRVDLDGPFLGEGQTRDEVRRWLQLMVREGDGLAPGILRFDVASTVTREIACDPEAVVFQLDANATSEGAVRLGMTSGRPWRLIDVDFDGEGFERVGDEPVSHEQPQLELRCSLPPDRRYESRMTLVVECRGEEYRRRVRLVATGSAR